MQLAVVMSGTIIALTCGWLLLPSFTAPLPVPAWLIPVTPVVKQDMTKDIAHVVMRDSEALSVLYGVWGTRSQPIRLVRSGSKSGAGM